MKQLSHRFVLTEFEENLAARWLETPQAKHALKNGAQMAFIFSWSSGIGRAATISLKTDDGAILSKDITDIDAW
jgi:hypothetical protein